MKHNIILKQVQSGYSSTLNNQTQFKPVQVMTRSDSSILFVCGQHYEFHGHLISCRLVTLIHNYTVVERGKYFCKAVHFLGMHFLIIFMDFVVDFDSNWLYLNRYTEAG